MHIPRFFRSRHSGPEKPSQANPHNALGVGVPRLKFLLHIRKFFRFKRSRSQMPPHADSSRALGGLVSPSLPFLKPDTLQQGMDVSVISLSNIDHGLVQCDPVGAHQNIPDTSPGPLSHSPQPATLLLESNAIQELDPHSTVTPLPMHLTSPSRSTDPDPQRLHQPSVIPQPSVSQPSLPFYGPTVPPQQYSPQPHDGNSYQLHAGQDIRMIQESRNVYIDGNNSNVNYTNTLVNNTSYNFMEKLWDRTIQGAAFDSSARDPPPRCHPGTRLAVIARCLEFIANASGEKKLRWIVGQAGVGKSAIMQNVAESPLPCVSQRVSVFLSINGRNDGSKIIVTLVYQLAAKFQPYRELIEFAITRDPSLLRSSMLVQFQKLIIEPFVTHRLRNSVDRILIIIDGLDECDKLDTQRELLRLITNICSAHPSSPIVWIVASRPEHHITTFFAQDSVQAVYEKEEIEVDSDEARSDVERFLRTELTRIQKQFSLSPRSQWPIEPDCWKLASASGGLFAFAQTVIKYIGDPEFGDPTSQLKDVLKAIDAVPLLDVPREQHPLALLDVLYARILSKVPERIMVNTRRILLALVLNLTYRGTRQEGSFLVLCNWLGMTCDQAYAALRHLGSVLDVPVRDKAHEQKLRCFHKSFIDYISDFSRSGFSSNIEDEAHQLEVQYTTRILKQAPGGIDCGDMDPGLRLDSHTKCATLVLVPGAGSRIVLTWTADGDSNWSDKETRLGVYKWACLNVVEGIKNGMSDFGTEFYIRTVITQFAHYTWANFPWQQLINFVFEASHRHEFIQCGILRNVPIQEFDFARMTWCINLWFRRPYRTTRVLSDPWKPSCRHKQVDWGGGKDEDWTTDFDLGFFGCNFCRQRLEEQLKYWKTKYPEHDVTLLLTSAQISFVEFQFIDPDDGVSKWTYWIPLEVSREKYKQLSGAV